MFVQDIYIERVDWHVHVYHAVDAMWADEICDDLIRAGCRGKNLTEAKAQLWKGLPDNGLTYTNIDTRETIMVIGFTSSAREYWNTLDHEKLHLLQDISICCGIDPYGEEISYISGELVRSMYDAAKGLLCECCRTKRQKRTSRVKRLARMLG